MKNQSEQTLRLPHSQAFFRLVDESIDAIVIIDSLCQIRYVNGALERLTGYGFHELAGESLNGLLPENVARQHDAYVQRYLGSFHVSALLGKVRRMEIRHRTGVLIPVELKALDLGMEDGERLFGAVMVDSRQGAGEVLHDETLAAFPMAYPPLASAAMHLENLSAAARSGEDVSKRELERLQAFKLVQAEIMEQIAMDAPLQNVLQAIARMLETYDPRYICSILLLDDDGEHLRLGAAPSLSHTFNKTMDGIAIGPSAGSCGAAVFLKRDVIVSDIAIDPRWETYRDLALSHGLRACWSMPILSATDTVLGALAMYALTPGEPSNDEQQVHRSCCHLASVAIERHRIMQELQESKERFREQASLLDNSQDAILTRTLDGIITYWNKGAERLFGWSRDEMLNRPIADLLYQGEDRAAFEFNVMNERLLTYGDYTFETRVQDRFGRRLFVEVRKSVVKHPDGTPKSILVALTNITQRKRAEEEIYHLAFHDQLTRLPNRRMLNDRIQRALAIYSRNGQQGALVLIDLDNFKTINDSLGHDIGDLLIKLVAERLTSCVRSCDTVARLGGDEFVVLLEELGEQEEEALNRAEIVTSKIAAVLGQPYDLQGYEQFGTASIGVALFSGRPAKPETLLKEADLAMYRAKAEGRNAVRFFDPQMQSAVARRSVLQNDLRLALARQEFELHYQPQVDQDGVTTGVEALLRWKHPRKGYISPGEFIPLAEDTGLMHPLGKWVVAKACQVLAQWRDSPCLSRLDMSVNVSLYEFRRPDFIESLLRAIEETGADPRRLKIEITESVFADNMEETVAKMMALQQQGISFALDDFGTGYSCLSYLKRLPLNQLKIDQSFIRDILTDANDASISRTIIALATTLGLNVIAEGVETAEQRQFLLQNGCHAYQGYLFSKPLPEADLTAFVCRDQATILAKEA